MIYVKTSKGRAALTQRHAVSLRERQLMVLCNGVRSLDELTDLFGESIDREVDSLEVRGLIRAQLSPSAPMPLEALLADKPEIAGVGSAHPPRSFVASRLATHPPPVPEPESLPRLSLEELTKLAAVPPVRAEPAEAAAKSQAPAAPVMPPARSADLARLINSIDAEPGLTRSVVAAQVYVTQVLIALGTPEALELVETHGGVQHEVDVLLYLAQGIGQTHRDAGEDVALRVALRVGRLLPEASVPMLLDCTLDYVPEAFTVLLYEFVLAGRDMH